MFQAKRKHTYVQLTLALSIALCGLPVSRTTQRKGLCPIQSRGENLGAFLLKAQFGGVQLLSTQVHRCTFRLKRAPDSIQWSARLVLKKGMRKSQLRISHLPAVQRSKQFHTKSLPPIWVCLTWGASASLKLQLNSFSSGTIHMSDAMLRGRDGTSQGWLTSTKKLKG